MEKDCLPLPVDADGNPDWVYMEEHMKGALKAAQVAVDALSCLQYENESV